MTRSSTPSHRRSSARRSTSSLSGRASYLFHVDDTVAVDVKLAADQVGRELEEGDALASVDVLETPVEPERRSPIVKYQMDTLLLWDNLAHEILQVVDVIAEGVVQATKEVGLTIPLIVDGCLMNVMGGAFTSLLVLVAAAGLLFWRLLQQVGELRDDGESENERENEARPHAGRFHAVPRCLLAKRGLDVKSEDPGR